MPAQSEQLKPPVEDLTAGGSNYDVEKEESYYLAGRRAYLSRNWKSAVDNYSVVVEMKTGSYLNREALYYLARTNYLRGELGLAEQYYLQYLKEFKDTAYYDDSLFYLGCIYWKQNNLTWAREVLQELKSIAPQSGYLSSNLCVKVMP
jgi:TolA-binding protein